MSSPYCCPNCRTNRTRFNIIRQEPRFVKMDPFTGEIVEEYSVEQLTPYHQPYNGPSYRVQCGACGLIEDEQTFIQFGKRQHDV